MKKIVCFCCCLLIMGCTACTASPAAEYDRRQREIKLSAASGVPEQPSAPDTSAPSTVSAAPPDRLASFTRIAKADALPDYMLNHPQLYADLLENILKIYYSGLLDGKINSAVFAPRYASDKLPSPHDTPEERKRAADYCTVGGALEYFGCDEPDYMKYLEMYNGTLPYFWNDRDAHIYLQETPPTAPHNYVLPMNGFSQTLYFIFRYANDNRIAQDVLNYAARNIDTYVKNYYQGILSGTITSADAFTYTHDLLPPQNASPAERRSCAASATITGALDYAGFYTVYAPYISSLGYNKASSLFTLPDFHNPDIIALTSNDAPLSRFFPS